MTCTIRRRASGTNDSGEDNGAFSDLATSVPCRLSQLSGKEQYESSVQGVVTHKLFFTYGQDITARDQIANIVNSDGTTLVSAAVVEMVYADPGGMQSHVEVWLREVR